jgi:hypothetical protein
MLNLIIKFGFHQKDLNLIVVGLFLMLSIIFILLPYILIVIYLLRFIK